MAFKPVTSKVKMKGGGANYTNSRPQKTVKLSPIDRRLGELKDEAGKPRSRRWLAQQVGVSYTCIYHWCKGQVPDSLKSVYVCRAMQVLEIDENYWLGLPR